MSFSARLFASATRLPAARLLSQPRPIVSRLGISSSGGGGLIAMRGVHSGRSRTVFDKGNERLIYLLLGLNAAVFLGWQYSHESLRRFNDPRPYLFMVSNFFSGEANLRQGRWWTLLTSCISHDSTPHFLLNMISFAFMAPPVLALTGPVSFLGLYFGAGLVSSTVSGLWRKYGEPMLDQMRETRSPIRRPFTHGASGSVYAIMSAFACIQPRATFLIFFVIPAPAWACVSGIFAWDLYNATVAQGSIIDSAGHLGGILAGVLFWRLRLGGVRF